MIQFQVCEKCYKILKRKSPVTASIWMDICEIDALTIGIFGVKRIYQPALRRLENYGFLVSSETNEMTMIKVIGKKANNFGEFFCGGLCER